MNAITLEEAQANLPSLIEHLVAGEELVIVHNARPVAKLVGTDKTGPRPIFGRGRGIVELADDDEHLQQFADIP